MYRSVHTRQVPARDPAMPAPVTDARTRILDAAIELFHARGVSATGLEQILAASRTGKGQFYHYFASKEDLVLEVLRTFRGRLASDEAPVKQELATWKDLEAWFDVFLRFQADARCERNCPIATIAAELTATSGPLRDEARA